MVAGTLGYLLIMHLSQLATKASTVLGYSLGLRKLPLVLLAGAMQVTAFAAIGVVVWWYIASRSPSEGTTKSYAPTKWSCRVSSQPTRSPW